MTIDTDLDRLLASWLDDGPSVMPDRVTTVVADRIGRQSQRRSWRLDGRPTVNLFLKLAATAALLVAAIGGVALLAGGGGIGPRPSPTPSQTTAPAPSVASVPVPAGLIGTWVADVPAIDGLGNTDPRIRLVTSNDGAAFWLRTNELGNTTMRTAPTAVSGEAIDIVATLAGGGCAVGDAGSYRTTLSDDGVRLTLEAVDDACATRATALARTWTRAIDAASHGGLGVIAAFDPPFTIELPAGGYTGSRETNAVAEVASTDGTRTLLAVVDPWGATNPCAEDVGGDKVPVKSTADDYAAYLASLPGIDVTTSELTIDGHRAVRADVTSDAATECASGEVVTWIPKAFTSQSTGAVPVGGSDSYYLAEVGDDLVLLQWAGDGVTPDEASQVLSTIAFLDGLPTAP